MRVASLRLSVLGALFATLLLPGQARAHGHLVRARPGAGDTVHVAPRLLRLEFSEAPELAVSGIRLADSLERQIPLLPPRIAADSARVLIADIEGHLAPGRYTVTWQIAGRDGHPVRGQFTFVFAEDARRVGAPTPVGAVPVAGMPAAAPARRPIPAQTHLPQGFDSESLAYVLVRWAHFAGLLVVIGGVAFYWLVLGRVLHSDVAAEVIHESAARVRRVALAGAALLGVAAIARLLAQWTALRVSAVAPSAMPLGRVVWDSAWGHAWLLEVAALVVTVVGFSLARRVGWGLAAVGTIGLASAEALSGHAAVGESIVPVVIDVVHVLAAGSWMGALMVLLVAGLPAARSVSASGRAMVGLVNAFSAAALASAGVVALTGFAAAWRNVGSVTVLAGSTYGRVLLLKLAVLGVAALVGLYNWRRARPALAVSSDDTALRRAIRAELTAAAVILLVTAVLVATPTPVELGMIP